MVGNLLTDYKSEVWRSATSTTSPVTATITIQWPTAELAGMLALAFASLTSAATFRVRAYAVATDTAPTVDKTEYACSSSAFEELGWGSEPLGVNAYSYGGGTYGVIWFPVGSYQKIVLDITDINPLGYIEASRLICGTYWSPANNAEYGAQITIIDGSKNERTDAGDLRTDRGTVHKTLQFDLVAMNTGDRNSLMNILRGNGKFRPIYVSLIPEADNPTDEQVYQVYGKMSNQASIKFQFLNQFNTSLEIEES